MVKELSKFGLDQVQNPASKTKKETKQSQEAFYQLECLRLSRKKEAEMAKTKSSTRGVQNKKIVVVKPYRRSDGTRVGGHRRSTPN